VNAAAGAPPRDYGRWRALVLILVHVLIGLHIAHWLVAGRTLAPLEFNEVMHTLELGLVTAGFLLMATAVLATAVFGRFFCGWACHVLALQDLCVWLLKRAGIAAKPVRSRALRVAPFVVMGYMFVWPQLVRWWHGDPLPALHIAGTEQAWASLVTNDFWRNLPGPWIGSLTLATCGFAVVYLLGSRAFCFAGCPYGAVFALASRLAPGSIRLRGACNDCGRCTAACQSGIWVHEEVRRFGQIVDSRCLRDLDCVAACPEGALAFGLGRPAGLRSLERGGSRRPPNTWTWFEDVLAGATMLAGVLVYRGLYGEVPFLMAVGIGACLACLAVMARRMLAGEDVRLRGLELARSGRRTGIGWIVIALLGAVAAFTAHSAVVRWHEAAGLAAFERVRATLASGGNPRDDLAAALDAHDVVERWGLSNPVDHSRRLASLHAWSGAPTRAEPHLRGVLAHAASDHEARMRLAAVLAGAGRTAESLAELRELALAHRREALAEGVRVGAVRVAERLSMMAQQRGSAADHEAALAVIGELGAR